MALPLPELQRRFAAAVFDDAPPVQACIRPGRFGAARSLQVYKNNTFASLTDALAAVFPVVQRLVSEDFFAFVADRYIRKQPPRGGYLHAFGNSFPDFLAGFEPARTLAYLPDVARLEWAWHEAFHAADADALDPASLASVPARDHGKLRFVLHPSARLVSSGYPIRRIWQANLENTENLPAIDLMSGGEHLLVIRRALQVEVESLSAGIYALLGGFADAATFETACERAFAAEPALDLAATLRRLVASATVVAFVMAGERHPQ